MAAPKNELKARMAAGDVLRGPFLSLGSETVAEIAGRAPFDFCLVDAEHGPFDPVTIQRQLMALGAVGMPAAVRVPVNADWVLKQALDVGAQTVMVPMVNTAEEAAAAVRACRYPPGGIRGLGGSNMRAGGFGATLGYPQSANAEVCVILQVETRHALDNLEAIAAVDGVDALFIGPADLACDMGFTDDLAAAPVWEAVADALRRIAASSAAAGVFAPPEREADLRAAGATVFGIGSDASALTRAMQGLAAGPA